MWRLFRLGPNDNTTAPADQLGTQLDTGSGNVASYIMSTDNLSANQYQLGLSATDTGSSIAATVADGDSDRIVTVFGPIIDVTEPPADPTPPTIEIIQPTGSSVMLFRDEALEIQFLGTVTEPGATGVIDVFYDDDKDYDNGFELIAVDQPTTVTTAIFPTNLPEGTYYIGASILDGISPMVVRYADPEIEVVRTVTVDVTEPSSTLPVSPGTDVAVAWSTNAPTDVGTLDVFARTVDSGGVPFGAEIPILTDQPLTTESATFSTTTSGVYQISVRIDFNAELGEASITETAPQFVRISSLPPVLWLGSLTDTDPPFDGAIFEGVNFEDNAGSAFAAPGDLDGDDADDFVIAARYGKPFFKNPSGIGPGEAYIVYGELGEAKLQGRYNLNAVGTSSLRGLTATGIRTAGDANGNDTDETDGLSDVTVIPDADDDGLPEMVFGFPRTDSRPLADWADPTGPSAVGALEAEGQFLRGGVVILSSDNSQLQEPAEDDAVIHLQAVGQRFSDLTMVSLTEEILTDQFVFQEADPDQGTPAGCINGTDGIDDTVTGPSVGFIPALAPPRYSQLGFTVVPTGTTESAGVCITRFAEPACYESALVFANEIPGSGFYTSSGNALEPRGARIIGEVIDDGFGTSVTSSNSLGDSSPGDLIISAPNRTAQASQVSGIDTDIVDAGVAYLADNRYLWGRDFDLASGLMPPRPHQYMMDVLSHCGDSREDNLTALRIAGDTSDQITNIVGIADFNADGRNDFAVGAPDAAGGQGRVYIAFRRDQALEGDFVLNKLELDPTDQERLSGVLIVATATSGLGASVATDVDFNGDGVSDLVIGAPMANAGVGEIIVVFGDPNLVSPVGGISVATLLTTRNAQGQPRAARITGNPLDTNGQFGFNVANAGDVDGDGLNDLLIAAPNASPRFDPDATDSTDALTEPGVDVDFNGLQDDISGPLGVADGNVDAYDDLTNAGLVYLILSSNRLDQLPSTDISISIDQLGTSNLRGLIIAGRRAGDRIGGGDAGDAAAGGLLDKLHRGRSDGLGSAGDVDGDGQADILIGSVLADPRVDPATGVGTQNAGEAYLIYGSVVD